MTEEIIIDCGWYRNGWCGCETEDKKCEQIKLCKFKDDKLKQQLKRLEQERDELKKQNAILLGQLVINDGEDVTVQISQSQFDEYNELKQENKELKELNKKICEDWEKVIKVYWNALEEISGLASPHCTQCSQIINVINEVLE